MVGEDEDASLRDATRYEQADMRAKRECAREAQETDRALMREHLRTERRNAVRLEADAKPVEAEASIGRQSERPPTLRDRLGPSRHTEPDRDRQPLRSL